VFGDLAGPVLEDQLDALGAAAAEHPGLLDLDRVAIRGWSFGGFLAALAVLERPDVVHAAIAGAPVTDWALYDTHYTERYLGTPRRDPAAYERSSLLSRAGRLERPLLLLHGLADDNVVVAHTLRLSNELFEAGRRHELVLLPDATHVTRSEVAVERRFDLELDFLHRSLGIVSRDGAQPVEPG
jgi:dipeptidyl-peptidase-4